LLFAWQSVRRPAMSRVASDRGCLHHGADRRSRRPGSRDGFSAIHHSPALPGQGYRSSNGSASISEYIQHRFTGGFAGGDSGGTMRSGFDSSRRVISGNMHADRCSLPSGSDSSSYSSDVVRKSGSNQLTAQRQVWSTALYQPQAIDPTAVSLPLGAGINETILLFSRSLWMRPTLSS
jgi:hypothetical protein